MKKEYHVVLLFHYKICSFVGLFFQCYKTSGSGNDSAGHGQADDIVRTGAGVLLVASRAVRTLIAGVDSALDLVSGDHKCAQTVGFEGDKLSCLVISSVVAYQNQILALNSVNISLVASVGRAELGCLNIDFQGLGLQF